MILIRNKKITTPIISILNTMRTQSNVRGLKDIVEKPGEIIVTCPHHKDGDERKPSCHIYCGEDKSIPYGTCNCFSCEFSANFQGFVAEVLGISVPQAEDYLIENFSSALVVEKTFLPKIELTKPKETKKSLNEDDLLQFAYYHPYMWKRRLTKDVVDKFKVGYDKETDCITFPVWDKSGDLVAVTKRSVTGKYFFIPQGSDKQVYGLNFVLKENIKSVFVVESQINCLVMWSYGYPAIGLFGTGCKHQYDILNKTSIRSYTLLFDGDKAGRSGAERFKKNIRDDVLVTDILMYEGKDVADLERDQLEILLKNISKPFDF